MTTSRWDDTADAWASAGEKAAPWFTPGKVAVMAVLGVVGIIVLALVGWQVGWWFTNANNNRQALLFQHSYGAQSAYVEEVHQEIVEFNALNTQVNDPSTPAGEKPSLVAQQQAIINQACGQLGNVSITIPSDEKAWSNTYCSS